MILSLTKTWSCENQTFAFSAWCIPPFFLTCAIEHSKVTDSCEVIVDYQIPSSLNWNIEGKFAEALRSVLS